MTQKEEIAALRALILTLESTIAEQDDRIKALEERPHDYPYILRNDWNYPLGTSTNGNLNTTITYHTK